MAYRPSSLLRAPNPMVGIASSTCPSGRPASLVTLPVMVTGSCAASRAGSARNALRMIGTTRLRTSCMSPPMESVTTTTGTPTRAFRLERRLHDPQCRRAHDDGGNSGRRAVDRDLHRDNSVTARNTYITDWRRPLERGGGACRHNLERALLSGHTPRW